MPKDEIKFVLSTQTDTNFQKALQVLQTQFPAWKVTGVRRDVVNESGVAVAVGVIEIAI